MNTKAYPWPLFKKRGRAGHISPAEHEQAFAVCVRHGSVYIIDIDLIFTELLGDVDKFTWLVGNVHRHHLLGIRQTRISFITDCP